MKMCDEYGELISAAVDGELAPAERHRLDEHVAACANCRIQWERFQQIDRMVAAPPIAPDKKSCLQAVESLQMEPGHRWSSRLWAPLIALAALLLVAMTIGLFLRDTGGINTSYAEPIANLEAINLVDYRDQESMLQTMEWDLRVMKLEAGVLELDDQESVRINNRINDLMAKVHHLGQE